MFITLLRRFGWRSQKEKDIAVLTYIHSHPNCFAREIAMGCRLGRVGVYTHLFRLEEEGWIRSQPEEQRTVQGVALIPRRQYCFAFSDYIFHAESKKAAENGKRSLR